MKELFKKESMVHFGDADPQGILYFARVQELAHELIEEFCASTPLGWNGWFNDPNFAVPLRHTEQEYFAPIPAGVTFLARLLLTELGESSVQFKVEFIINNNKLAATAKSVHVFVRKSDFSKISLPPAVRAILDSN